GVRKSATRSSPRSADTGGRSYGTAWSVYYDPSASPPFSTSTIIAPRTAGVKSRWRGGAWGNPSLSLGVRPQPRRDVVAGGPAAGDVRDELDGFVRRGEGEPVTGAFKEEPGRFQRRPLVPVVKDLISGQAVEIERRHVPDGGLRPQRDPRLHKVHQRFQARRIDDVLLAREVEAAGGPDHSLVHRLQLLDRQVSHRFAKASQTVR